VRRATARCHQIVGADVGRESGAEEGGVGPGGGRVDQSGN
jgi:hypothetical protein